MRSNKCDSLSYYFDPNTRKCHPCADCGPGRSPIKICIDQCNRRKQEEMVASDDNPNSNETLMDHRYVSLAIVVGVLVLSLVLLVATFLICKLRQRNNSGQRQTPNYEFVTQPNNNNNIETLPSNRPTMCHLATFMNASDSDIDTNKFQHPISPEFPSAAYWTGNTDLLLLPGCGTGYAMETSASRYGCYNGHPPVTVPLLVGLMGNSDTNQSSLPTAMDHQLFTDVETDGTSLSQRQRHVCFSDEVQCREFSNDSGSCSDGRLPSECTNVNAVVYNPQQNDSSYNLTPSVHSSLPASLTWCTCDHQ